MGAPPDADDVLAAVRLGWTVAEVRGRCQAVDGPGSATEGPPGRALPLRCEQDADGRRAEAIAALKATFATVAQKVPALDQHPGDDAHPYSALIAGAATAIDAPPPDSDDAKAVRQALAALLQNFDAHAQIALEAASDRQACGYLLGRGLAEAFWALTDDASGKRLLGEARCKELSRLLGRLSAYFNAYTAPSIEGSLVVWQQVAATPDWWAEDTGHAELYQQTRRWYELLVIGQDPTTLVKPFALLRSLRTSLNAIRMFLPQLVLGAVSILVLFGLVAAANTPLGKTFGVVVGGLGITFSSIVARAKSTAQGLTTRLKEDAYADLVAVAITIVPPRAPRDRPDNNPVVPKSLYSPTRRAVSAALQNRKLTTPVMV
jgi:hypothetical protein